MYEGSYQENKRFLARRWSLNCAIAICKDSRFYTGKTVDIITIAKEFEKYLLGEKDENDESKSQIL